MSPPGAGEDPEDGASGPGESTGDDVRDATEPSDPSADVATDASDGRGATHPESSGEDAATGGSSRAEGDRDEPGPDDGGSEDTAPVAGGEPGAADHGPSSRPARGGDGAVAAGSGRPVGEDRRTVSGEDDEGWEGWQRIVYDVVSSAVAVLLVGALLFAVSGVWPPMVAVESPSMTPNMKTGDLVFVMEADRFPGEGAHEETGVVTARTGRTTDADYRKFGHQGDVIVYAPDGNEDRTPIIHRAMFWVEEGENWYDEADRQAVGRYSECGETPGEALPNCPAPHAGFITKGDANGVYDQAQGLSAPVRPSWVVGTAEVRVPLLGCVRLRTDRCTNAVLWTGASATPAGTGVTTAAWNRTELPT